MMKAFKRQREKLLQEHRAGSLFFFSCLDQGRQSHCVTNDSECFHGSSDPSLAYEALSDTAPAQATTKCMCPHFILQLYFTEKEMRLRDFK